MKQGTTNVDVEFEQCNRTLYHKFKTIRILLFLEVIVVQVAGFDECALH